MSVEEWRWAPGFEGRYEVSNEGRVRSWAKRGHPTNDVEPHLLTQTFHNDYCEVTMHFNGVRSIQRVHQLVVLAFCGPRPEGLEVRHLNGNARDNRAANLRYGTRSENAQDTVRHGRNAHASKTHCPKGHEYTPENTYLAKTSSGHRRKCRECLRSRDRRRYHRSRLATT